MPRISIPRSAIPRTYPVVDVPYEDPARKADQAIRRINQAYSFILPFISSPVIEVPGGSEGGFGRGGGGSTIQSNVGEQAAEASYVNQKKSALSESSANREVDSLSDDDVLQIANAQAGP